MMNDMLLALWFLLPAAVANVAPILSNKMPYVNRWGALLDGGKSYRGKQIFGAHKTWRGLLSGIVAGTLTLALEQSAVRHFGWAADIVSGITYTTLPTFVLGPLFGIGALGGDAVESFFKRQRDIAPGHSWVPFDQLDYIIGGVIVSLPFVVLAVHEYVFIFIIWFIIHLLASYFGYKVGLKERPI